MESAKTPKEIASIILKDCASFIKECRKSGNNNMIFYRGAGKNITDNIQKEDTWPHRRPRDTPEEIHNKMDELFCEKFWWRARSEFSAFVTADKKMADRYGHLYIFCPIGDYKYVWSPKIKNLLLKLQDKNIIESNEDNKLIDNTCNCIDVDTTMKTIVNEYLDRDLFGAYKSCHEIMFRCHSYYLLDVHVPMMQILRGDYD